MNLMYSLFSMAKKKIKLPRLLLVAFLIGIYIGRQTMRMGKLIFDNPQYAELAGVGFVILFVFTFYFIVKRYQRQLWNKVIVDGS